MSENDWPDHHTPDPGDHHDLGHDLDPAAGHPVPDPADDPWHLHDDLGDDEPHHDPAWDHDDDAHTHPATAADDDGFTDHTPTPDAHDDTPPAEDTAEEVFPPMLHVGPLPEPVDGFPWIDTSSLGLAHAGVVDQAMLDRMPAQDPAELAEYAAEDLPPGVDPWAHLAGSEDPATAALAEYYRPGDTDA